LPPPQPSVALPDATQVSTLRFPSHEKIVRGHGRYKVLVYD
jgi:hypothetical protein